MKKQIISLILLLAMALPLASCAPFPSDNVPEATVAPETTANEETMC